MTTRSLSFAFHSKTPVRPIVRLVPSSSPKPTLRHFSITPQSIFLRPNHEHRCTRRGHGIHRSVTALPTHQKRWKSSPVESTQHPLSGLWKPTHLHRLYYGPESVKKHLLDCLPTESSKAFIITGNSLATKTKLIEQVEEQLGSKHVGTYSKIGQHAPIKQLDEATELVKNDKNVDTIISIGGGSPIDSAKAISHRLNEKTGKWLYHITIPTTLSAAECTMIAGYTDESGLKTGVGHPELAVHVILYDSKFALETPPWLLMSTAMRSVDHSMELMCTFVARSFSSTPLCSSTDTFQTIPRPVKCPANKWLFMPQANSSPIYLNTKQTPKTRTP